MKIETVPQSILSLPVVRGQASEYKIVHAFITKVDAAQGIIEAIVSTMGVIDMGGDIVHNGAYTKTINERMGKIRVLDNHQTNSILNITGKPLSMREISRTEMPTELLQKFPEATGGLWTQSKFYMTTDDDKRIFERVADGNTEWSIGYDALDYDYSNITLPDGKKITVRNLRTIRLWEYSPVLWGMNQATLTTGAKGSEGATPEQERIPVTVQRKDQSDAPNYRPSDTNSPIQCSTCLHYDTSDPNKGYCRLYNFMAGAMMTCDSYKPGNKSGVPEKPADTPDVDDKVRTENGPVQIIGDFLVGAMHSDYNFWLSQMFMDGFLTETQYFTMATLGLDMVTNLRAAIPQDIARIPLVFRGMDMMSGLWRLTDDQRKAGRVLSQRNVDRLNEALATIQAVLSEAAANEGSEEEASDGMQNVARSESPAFVKPQAGSSDTPTLEEVRALRQQLIGNSTVSEAAK